MSGGPPLPGFYRSTKKNTGPQKGQIIFKIVKIYTKNRVHRE